MDINRPIYVKEGVILLQGSDVMRYKANVKREEAEFTPQYLKKGGLR